MPKSKHHKKTAAEEQLIAEVRADPLFAAPPASDKEKLKLMRHGRYVTSMVFMERPPGEPSFVCRHFCRRFKTGGEKCEKAKTGKFPAKGFCDPGFDLIDATVQELDELVLLSWASSGGLDDKFSMQPKIQPPL